jgi:hypothetical protein
MGRDQAGPALAHLSLLRTLDIVIWMQEKGPQDAG